MEYPLISIIVPVYNIEEYLPRCVKTLRGQTYPRIEILLVDDGSTDGTGSLCDRLAEEDARIRVFHKENGGSSSARNLGIAAAKANTWVLWTAMIMWNRICMKSYMPLSNNTMSPRPRRAGMR